MGRINPRDAGRRPMDPQTLIMAILLGVVVTAAFTVQLSLWAAVKLGAAEMDLSINPFETLLYLATGRLPWPPVATVVAVIVWVFVGVIGIGIRRFRRRSASKKFSIDRVQQYLAPEQDIESLSKKAVEADAAKFMHPERLMNPEKAGTAPGLCVGKVPGTKKGLYGGWEDTYLIIFGARMGKTSSQVIPAIVDAPGAVITTSNKRDIVDGTILVAANRGEVWVFDPQNIAPGLDKQHGFQGLSMYFDPLDRVRNDPEQMDAAAMALADIFLASARSDNSGGDAFFTDSGRDLLGRLFLAATVGNQPITAVSSWVNDESDREPITILSAYPQWENHALALAAMYDTPERTRTGYFGQARQMAKVLGLSSAERWIVPSAARSKFDAAAFVRSTDTLYLLSKDDRGASAGPLTSALVATVLEEAERYSEECGGRLPVPLVAALDEAANAVRWPQLPQLYSHYGSRGIILMTILQGYAQGERAWGKEGMEALWSTASMAIVGPGIRDTQFLTQVETLIGEYETWETSTSRSKDGISVSSSKREKKILTVAELAAMPRLRAVLLASRRRPILVETGPWWERDWPKSVKKLLGKPQLDAAFFDAPKEVL